MGKVYQNARLKEVAPDVRMALRRAGDSMEVDHFVRKLEESATLVNEGDAALTRPVYRPFGTKSRGSVAR